MLTKYTPNYNFAMPDPDDFVDIGVLNGNFSEIDVLLKECIDLGSMTKEAITTAEAAQTGVDTLNRQKGAAGGIATLNASSRLVQMPTLSEVGGSNRNLLDNWYFLNSVNQRGKTSYTSVNNALTGTIDRCGIPNNASMLIDSKGITLTRGETPTDTEWMGLWVQTIDNFAAYKGKRITFSVLVPNMTGSIRLAIFDGISYKDSGSLSGAGLHSKIFTISPDATTLRYFIGTGIFGKAVSITLTATKAELGNVQTLAGKDANGNWVLTDPPPDYGQELAKCQRYYQLYTSAAARPASGVDCRPTMRLAKPTQGTVTVNGVTYYYNDASV